jgi:hypothetical protein
MWSTKEGMESSLLFLPTRLTSKKEMSLTNRENSWPLEIKFYSRKSVPRQGLISRSSSRKSLPSFLRSTSLLPVPKQLITLHQQVKARSSPRALQTTLCLLTPKRTRRKHKKARCAAEWLLCFAYSYQLQIVTAISYYLKGEYLFYCWFRSISGADYA